MKYLKYTAYVLTIIGALNWGLVGLFGLDLVAALFGDMTVLSRIIYALVGVSAITSAAGMYKCNRTHRDSCEYGTCSF